MIPQSDFDRLKEEVERLKGERDERSDFLDAERARFDRIHDALEARAEAAEATLSEVVGVLTPFARPTQRLVWNKNRQAHDVVQSPDNESAAIFHITWGDLRKAAALLQKLKAGVSPYAGERELAAREPQDHQCGAASPDGEVCGQPRSVSGAGWRDIASAPKDGKPFVVIGRWNRVHVVKWVPTYVLRGVEFAGQFVGHDGPLNVHWDIFTDWIPRPRPPRDQVCND